MESDLGVIYLLSFVMAKKLAGPDSSTSWKPLKKQDAVAQQQ